jgi:2-dehydro-3-deoxyphosphogluconate aldolase / (4S)-4-hydroxy-2-oxoglutarate aldolase
MTDSLSVTDQLAKLRLIPVVAIEDPAKAPALAEALLAGGLPVAEITFRTAAAAEAIEAMAKIDGLLVGAGTVLSIEQAERAVTSGARFIVSPGLDASIVRWCQEREIAVFPGIATPTDLMQAVALGLKVVKLFPAEALGGLSTMKALAGPFPSMRFIPTGGISAENVSDWLAHPKVLACGGSWMVAKSLIASGDFEEITRRVRGATELVG